MAKQVITESEYEIMKVLWSENGPLSLGEILAKLKGKWARNTVGTMLVRLCEKNVVSYNVKGKSYLYYAVLKENDYNIDETKSFLSKLYNGSIGNMIASLYENKEISNDEIDRLRKFINENSEK